MDLNVIRSSYSMNNSSPENLFIFDKIITVFWIRNDLLRACILLIWSIRILLCKPGPNLVKNSQI